jgi:hypothetical protein
LWCLVIVGAGYFAPSVSSFDRMPSIPQSVTASFPSAQNSIYRQIVALPCTQLLGPFVLVAGILALVPWVCFRRKSRRVRVSVLGLLLCCFAVIVMALFSPEFQQRFAVAISDEGEGVRFILWKEALYVGLNSPIWGAGAGSFAAMFEQSHNVWLPDLPMTPHNDYLLILSQYGLVGLRSMLLEPRCARSITLGHPRMSQQLLNRSSATRGVRC